MPRHKLNIPIVISLIFCFFNCSNDQVTKNDNYKIVDFKDIIGTKDTIDFILDADSTDSNMTFLETCDMCLIGDQAKSIVVDDKHILIENENGLLQFSRDGEFKKVLINKGKGPEEFIYLIAPFIYNEKLYFYDFSKDRQKIFCFDINNQEFNTIPIHIHGSIHDMRMQNDSTLSIIYDSISSNGIVAMTITQTLDGKLLYKELLDRYDMRFRQFYGPYKLINSNNKLAFIKPFCDTIKVLSGKQLIPKLVVRGLPEVLNTENKEKIDILKCCYYSERYSLFIHIQKSIRDKVVKLINEKIIMIDENNIPKVIGNIKVKKLNIEVSPFELNFDNSNYLIVELSSIELIERMGNSINFSDISNNILVNKDLNKLTIEDNPILIINEIGRLLSHQIKTK